jgi:hypothetical protein
MEESLSLWFSRSEIVKPFLITLSPFFVVPKGRVQKRPKRAQKLQSICPQARDAETNKRERP